MLMKLVFHKFAILLFLFLHAKISNEAVKWSCDHPKGLGYCKFRVEDLFQNAREKE